MLKPIEPTHELDRWVYGAKNLGLVVDLDERQAFYALEKGLLDADKFGGRWRSTKRRLLKLGPPPSEHQHHHREPAATAEPATVA
jgi:hypothetical protein